MTEWSLHPEVVNLIFRLWGTPVVDMFATVHNTHSSFHVSSSGTSSTGDRCFVTGLAGEVDVRVSTVSPAQQSHSEAQDHPDRRSNTHRPLVAISTVVSTPATTECGSCMILSVPQRPVVTTGRISHAALPSMNVRQQVATLR